jgi:hypothetical protein
MRKPVPSHKLTGRFQGAAGRYHESGNEAVAAACLRAADAYMTAALCPGAKFRATADKLAKEAVRLGAEI